MCVCRAGSKVAGAVVFQSSWTDKVATENCGHSEFWGSRELVLRGGTSCRWHTESKRSNLGGRNSPLDTADWRDLGMQTEHPTRRLAFQPSSEVRETSAVARPDWRDAQGYREEKESSCAHEGPLCSFTKRLGGSSGCS